MRPQVQTPTQLLLSVKGKLNPNIKLELNDSFCALINKYSNFAWFKRNFKISKSFCLLTNYFILSLKIELFYRVYVGCVVFTLTKTNLSASLGKRKKAKHFGVTNFDTQLHCSSEPQLNITSNFTSRIW